MTTHDDDPSIVLHFHPSIRLVGWQAEKAEMMK